MPKSPEIKGRPSPLELRPRDDKRAALAPAIGRAAVNGSKKR